MSVAPELIMICILKSLFYIMNFYGLGRGEKQPTGKCDCKLL